MPEISWRRIVERLPDAVAVLDADGSVRWASRSARLPGAPEEVVSRRFVEAVHPDDAERARAFLGFAARGSGGAGPLACRLRAPDGSWRPAEVLAAPLDDPATGALVLSVRDLDERATLDGAALDPTAERTSRSVLDALKEVVFQADPAGNWTYLNRAWAEITGFAVEATIGTNFMDYVHPDERERTVELFVAVVTGATDYCHHEGRYRCADGAYKWLELRASVVRDHDGAVVANAGTLVDVTGRRLAEELLAEQTELLSLVAQDAPLAEVQAAAAALVARRTGGSVRMRLAPTEEVRPGALGPIVAAEPSAPASLVVPVRSANGVEFGSIAVVADPPPSLTTADRSAIERCAQLVAIALERRRAQGEVRHQALHDPLTGLPNRTLVHDRLRQALVATRRHHSRTALMLVDLDRFKEVNDVLGHEAGDRALRQVSARLAASVRGIDTVGRLGGDEFVVVLPEVERPSDVEVVAHRTLTALRLPLELDDVVLHLDASIGVAFAPDHATDPATLLRLADMATYRAKRRGGGFALYEPRYDEERSQAMALASELRHAIDHGQLLLHYQPKVDLRSGRTTGVEALVRWRHPTRGLIPPDHFVPLAESTGLIKPLAEWVLGTAVAERRRWSAAGECDVDLAVNLSVVNLFDPDLPEALGRATDALGEAACHLELEITESAVMADPGAALSALARMAEAGIAFAIDDFGTGYSSLSYLKRLPARTIKIDKTFVRDIATDTRDASIVRSAVELAHDLGMGVVAEGVESRASCTRLAELSCDQAQGYYLAPPMPADALVAWLVAHRRPDAPAAVPT